MEAQQTSHRQAVTRVLEDYIAELLVSNDPTTVQTPPQPPAWRTLNEEARAELFELLQEAVAKVRRQ